MPLYEYRCEACGKDFVLLQPMSASQSGWACPHCGSTQSRRKLSAFASRTATPGGGTASAGAGCAPSG
ncbi:MAG: zinc ribbon domain-containing protein [Armatimonadota bacterium]|nr:zinc ribbon domain-containing protein [Armatimonadota bacterium]